MIKLDRPTKKGFKNVERFRQDFDYMASALGGVPSESPVGRHWVLETDAGPLRAHIFPAGYLDKPGTDTGSLTIFARFVDADRAHRMGITSANGKWNFHMGKISPKEGIAEFQRRLSTVRRRMTQHASTR
jgi:hypothetical protein